MDTEGTVEGGPGRVAEIRPPHVTCAHASVGLRLEAETRHAWWACDTCGVPFGPVHRGATEAPVDRRVVRQRRHTGATPVSGSAPASPPARGNGVFPNSGDSPEIPARPLARSGDRLSQEAQSTRGALDPEAVQTSRTMTVGQLVGLAECAGHLGLASRGRRPGNRLWELLRAGKLRGLPHLRLGRSYRFDLGDVDQWLKRQAANGANRSTRFR